MTTEQRTSNMQPIDPRDSDRIRTDLLKLREHLHHALICLDSVNPETRQQAAWVLKDAYNLLDSLEDVIGLE